MIFKGGELLRNDLMINWLFEKFSGLKKGGKTMKVIFAELPNNAERDTSIERETFPKGTKFEMAVYTDERREEFIKQCETADAIIDGYVVFDDKILSRLKKCKVITLTSTGWNNVDDTAAAKYGIRVSPIREYCTKEVADHTLSILLALERKLKIFDKNIQVNKIWDYTVGCPIERIEGQTLGIVGFGKIGKAVAKRAEAFGMNIITYDPYIPEEVVNNEGAKLVSIDDLLSESDVITIHMNLTSENEGFFNYEKFSKMKKKPYILNVARGAIINESDLARALDEGLLRGAGLDVLPHDNPDLNISPLVGRDNVIMTPHVAYYSETTEYLMVKYAAENAYYIANGQYDKAVHAKIVNEKKIEK